MSKVQTPEWAEGAILYDGFEDCLVGFGTQFNRPVAIYDYNKCLAKLDLQFRSECGKASACDCDHDLEAQEWMDFNVTGGWVGNHSNIFDGQLLPGLRLCRMLRRKLLRSWGATRMQTLQQRR